MENSNATRNGICTTVDYDRNGNAGDVVVSTTYASQRVFTYTGFGDGDFAGPTPGNLTVSEKNFMLGTYNSRRYTGELTAIYGYLYQFGVEPFLASGTVSSSYNKAVDKLYDKIRGDTAGLGEDIGERNETFKLLGKLQSPIRTFGEVTRDFARAAKKAKAGAKSIGGAYLTYAFGVAPILDDIQNATDQLDKHLDSVQTRVKVRAGNTSCFEESRVQIQGENRSMTNASDRTEIGVSYFVTDPALFTASKVGITNPVLTAYQLTRLSFLVDYVWNLGNYLDKCENALGFGLLFKSGYKTTSTSKSARCVWTMDFNSGFTRDTGYAHGHMAVRTKARTVLYTFPFPELPGLTNPYKPGGKRLLSMAALLTGLL